MPLVLTLLPACPAVCVPPVSLQLNLDALKSATLLSWLKDAGFYAMKNVSFDVSIVFSNP